MHTSKFATFVTLKIVVCIGSDYVEDVFSVRLVGLGCRWWSCDIDVCPNGCVRAVVVCRGVRGK